MATSYPGALDAFVNPLATDTLSGHATQHGNLNDAVEALQAKVGVDSSVNTASLDYRISHLPPSAVVQDASNRFVTDAEKTDWNAKQPAGDYANLASPAFTGPTTFTATTGDAVKITNTGTGNSFVVEDSAGDATPFVIDANGKVIVGGTSSITSRLIEIQDTGSSPFALVQTSDAPTSSSWVDYYRRRAAGAVSLGDRIGGGRFFGHDGTAYIEAARVLTEIDGTPGLNDMPGRLVFSTTGDNQSSPTERMRIDSAGNVGIGGAAGAADKLLLTGTASASGTVSYGVRNQLTINPAVATAGAYGCLSTLNVAAGTLPFLIDFHAVQGTLTGTLTTRYGFNAGNLIAATANYGFFANDTSTVTAGKTAYGFYSAVNTATGGGTTYGFYAAGTAPNRFVGETLVIGAAGLGYGAGAGGTVTQATSKATGVTLHKPCGAITMYGVNDAGGQIAAGGISVFTLTNSLIGSRDTLLLNINSGMSTVSNYRYWAQVYAGAAVICVENRTAGTLAEAIVFNFTVIKGSTT